MIRKENEVNMVEKGGYMKCKGKIISLLLVFSIMVMMEKMLYI